MLNFINFLPISHYVIAYGWLCPNDEKYYLIVQRTAVQLSLLRRYHQRQNRRQPDLNAYVQRRYQRRRPSGEMRQCDRHPT